MAEAAPPDAGAAASAEPAERAPAQADRSEKIKHKGFVLVPEVGAIGCTRKICAGSEGHDASPGVTAGAFLGGNIGGFVELGLVGGWGRVNAQVDEGANALGLYGIGPGDIPQEATYAGFDYGDYRLTSARLSDMRVGAALRVHLLPRGRVATYVGTGFAYHRFRGDYDTVGGNAQLSFHGLDVPVQGGLAVYINRYVAVGVEFDYLWTYFAAVQVKSNDGAQVAPLGVVEAQLQDRDISLTKNLPQFWTATVGVRLTL